MTQFQSMRSCTMMFLQSKGSLVQKAGCLVRSNVIKSVLYENWYVLGLWGPASLWLYSPWLSLLKQASNLRLSLFSPDKSFLRGTWASREPEGRWCAKGGLLLTKTLHPTHSACCLYPSKPWWKKGGLDQAAEGVLAPAASSQLLSFPRAHRLVCGISMYCWELPYLFCILEKPSWARTAVLEPAGVLCMSKSTVLGAWGDQLWWIWTKKPDLVICSGESRQDVQTWLNSGRSCMTHLIWKARQPCITE